MSQFGDDLEYRKEIVALLQQTLEVALSVPASSEACIGTWLAVSHHRAVLDGWTVQHQLLKNGTYRGPDCADRQRPDGRWRYDPEGVLLLVEWFDPVPDVGLLEGGFAEEAHFVRQTPDGRLVVFNDDGSVVYVWERIGE